ncbi:MAG: GNAT family N-acetyltransferase [Terracidiphilus sp.]
MGSPGSENELNLREMEPGDSAAASLLIGQLGYERSPQQVIEWIASLGTGREQAAFVACLGDEVVGWVEVSIERRLQAAPSAYIGGLVVKESVRGQGIGRALCRRAEAWGWDRCAETVRVTSRSTRLDAHRFYVNDGYQVVKSSLVFEKHRPSESRLDADPHRSQKHYGPGNPIPGPRVSAIG